LILSKNIPEVKLEYIFSRIQIQEEKLCTISSKIYSFIFTKRFFFIKEENLITDVMLMFFLICSYLRNNEKEL
jgi:hypothetical protein